MSKKRYLFHGTTKDGKDSIIENGIKLDVNNGKQYFGPGFYLTPNKGLAKSRKKHNSTILAYTIDTKDLKVKSYPSMTREWKEEVLQQRAYGNDVSKDFDCVVGPIADGAVGAYAEALASGDVTKNEFFDTIVNDDWKNRIQFVIKSQKAVDKLVREEDAEK